MIRNGVEGTDSGELERDFSGEDDNWEVAGNDDVGYEEDVFSYWRKCDPGPRFS